MRRCPSILVAILALVAPSAVLADVPDEPPADAEECTVEDKCPDTGVVCGSNPCFADQHCPVSGVECDWEDDSTYAQCTAGARAAGLEERCAEKVTVYCEPSEPPPEGSDAACRRKAEEDELEERCVNSDLGTVHCDPSEEEPGCAVERVGRSSGSGLALCALGLSAAAALIRGRRQRSSIPRR